MSRPIDHSMTEFDELFAEARESLIALSVDGRILAWNRGAETMFGYVAHEAIGRMFEYDT